MNKLSEYFVNFPLTIYVLTLFFGFGVISFVYQIIRNGKEFSARALLQHCVPFSFVRSKFFHMDVKIYIIRKFTDFIFCVPGLAVMAIAANLMNQSLSNMFRGDGLATPGYMALFICTLTLFLASEFSDYIVHYAEHKIPILWELHKVHHSAEDLNPLSGQRGHSIPLVYSWIVLGILVGTISGIFMFLYKMNLVELMALSALARKIGYISTLHPLKHSHFPVSFGWFDKIFISPHMHQVHHSKLEEHWDKNFGANLSIYDWLFKTGYKPKKGEKLVFGIAGYSDEALQRFNTFFGAYVAPLLKIKELVWKKTGWGQHTVTFTTKNNGMNVEKYVADEHDWWIFSESRSALDVMRDSMLNLKQS